MIAGNANVRITDSRKAEKIKCIVKLIISVLVLATVLYAAISFIPDVLLLVKEGDQVAMENYIRSNGKNGAGILVLLQVIQTITIVFPGIPIYMCAGIVFGRKLGTIICYVTYIAVNVGVFVFSRTVGDAADELMNNDKEAGISRLMNKSKHPVRLIAALCVLPIIPNGIIPHIAAKSSLSLKQFLLAVSVGCIPGIFAFVCCGDLILNGYFGLTMGICGGAVVLLIVSYIFKDKFAKIAENLLEKISGKNE